MYLFASDYDGTLNRGGISPAVREAIARFRAGGNLFGVVTGRDWDMFRILEKEKLPLDFILAMNGAMCIAADGGILDCARQKNDGCVRGIAEHVGARYGFWVRTVLVREAVLFDAAHPDGDERTAPLCRADADAPGGVREFSQMNTRCATAEEAARCTAEINARWGSAVHALQNGVCIDMPPAGYDKGVGVARYADRMGVPHENVYCAGDNMNDHAMIARFHGLAVENAVPALKETAEAVFPDVAAMLAWIMNKEEA